MTMTKTEVKARARQLILNQRDVMAGRVIDEMNTMIDRSWPATLDLDLTVTIPKIFFIEFPKFDRVVWNAFNEPFFVIDPVIPILDNFDEWNW